MIDVDVAVDIDVAMDTAAETTAAGYLLADLELGSSASLLTGVRYERTRTDYQGFELASGREQEGEDCYKLLPHRWETATCTMFICCAASFGQTEHTSDSPKTSRTA